MRLAIVVALVVGACAETGAPQEFSSVDQGATVCGSGPTVKGIDVSTYQGTIDWAKVKADGVEFAIIRVSDGLNSPDSKFAANWSGAKAAGIIRGAYQYFEPGQDPIAQADMLLAKIGTPMPDDLPPTIDVEATGGQTPAVVAARVKQWIDHVKAAVGKDPIVYTGFYFWRDSVGGARRSSVGAVPRAVHDGGVPEHRRAVDRLGVLAVHVVRHRSTASRAMSTPTAGMARWPSSRLHRHVGYHGHVRRRDLRRWRVPISCPGTAVPARCSIRPAARSTTVTRASSREGPTDFMRHVSTAGEGGDLIWTHTTDSATEANYGQWNLFLSEAGRYKVEAYTSAAFAQSTQASYVIHAGATDLTQVLDQTAADGWQTLGEFDFAAGADQWIHLGDNTGEPGAGNIQLVFDAVRSTRTGDPGSGSDGSNYAGPGGDVGSQRSGCNAGGSGSGLAVVFGLGAVVLRRRRRTR